MNPESSDEHAEAYRTYGDGSGAVPTIAFVDTEGNPISVIVGYRDAKQFAELMEGTLKEEERFQQLKTEIKEKPDAPMINAEIAIIYVKRGNFEKGKPIADKVFKLDPKNTTGLLPEIHLNLGLHYATHADGENAKDFYRNAETHFQTVIEKYAKSAVFEQAKYHLSLTYALQQRYQQAIEILVTLSDSKDDDIKASAAVLLDRIKTFINE